MSMTKKLINREIAAAAQVLRGTVVTNPAQKAFNPGGASSFTYVVDVDIGATKLLRDVPVKVFGSASRTYARIGSPVFLQRDVHGRYQVVAPSDRVTQPAVIQEYDEADESDIAAGSVGFTVSREPFEYYANVGGDSLWANGSDGFPRIRVLDGDGNEV